MAKKTAAKPFVADDFVAEDAHGATPFEADDFVAESPDVETGGVINTAVTAAKGVGKAFDYLRGATGGPLLAAALGQYKGQEHLDALNPFSTKTFPSSDELMERAGVNKGARLSDVFSMIPKDSFADISARGVGGFGLDTATDPLSYLSFGTSAAAKGGMNSAMKKLLKTPVIEEAAKVASAPSKMLSNMGKKVYSWGITPIEQAGERYGKDAVADTMYKHGIKGSGRQIEEKIVKNASKLRGERDALLDAADAAGANMDDLEMFGGFVDKLQTMVGDRRLSQAEADQILEGTIGTYLTGGKPSAKLATQWKSDVTKTLPRRAWDVTKGNTSIGQSLTKEAGKGLKEGVEKAVGRASGTDAMEILKTKNKELGELLSVMPSASQMADVGERRYWLTPWDVAFGGGGAMMSGNPAKGAAMLGAKKMLELGRLPWVRTNAGSAMRTMAEGSVSGPMLDILTRDAYKRLVKSKGGTDGEEK